MKSFDRLSIYRRLSPFFRSRVQFLEEPSFLSILYISFINILENILTQRRRSQIIYLQKSASYLLISFLIYSEVSRSHLICSYIISFQISGFQINSPYLIPSQANITHQIDSQISSSQVNYPHLTRSQISSSKIKGSHLTRSQMSNSKINNSHLGGYYLIHIHQVSFTKSPSLSRPTRNLAD